MACLKTCCCCCGTRAGSFIVGSLSILVTLLLAAALILVMVLYTVSRQLIDETLKDFDKYYDGYDMDHTLINQVKEYLLIILVVFLCIVLVYLAVTCLMIHGVRTARRMLMLPWMIWSTMELLLALVGDIWFLVLALMIGPAAYIAFAVVLVILLIWFYCILVVISEFKRIGEEGIDQVPAKL